MPRTAKAVVLLSGGLDSSTALAIALEAGYDPCALTFRYGQRHAVELEAARRISAHFQVGRHMIQDVDLRAIGGSALTADIDVPKGRTDREISAGVPATYVPARNTIFLSFALAWAEVLGSDEIFIGVNSLDYSGYPDCRPEFIASFERMANLATRAWVEGTRRLTIHAPLLRLTKAEIILKGLTLGVDYSLTTSCYDPAPGGLACGNCDSCVLRRRGFLQAGVPDPTRYAGGGATGP